MERIRVGIGGWVFPAWRDTFYPPALKRADELRYAASRLGAIEINATFHRTQTEASFRSWRAQAPDGFTFAVKASRGATHAHDAAPAVARFLGSGLTALGPALGPILWQFAPTRRFDPDGLARFLDLLPAERDGVALRHAIELRHPTARDLLLARLLAERGVALALVARPGELPQVALTAPFVYVRLEETDDAIETGYDPAGIKRWGARLRALAAGRVPADLADGVIGEVPKARGREVFAFVIAGAKRRNPAAALALMAEARGFAPGTPTGVSTPDP